MDDSDSGVQKLLARVRSWFGQTESVPHGPGIQGTLSAAPQAAIPAAGAGIPVSKVTEATPISPPTAPPNTPPPSQPDTPLRMPPDIGFQFGGAGISSDPSRP